MWQVSRQVVEALQVAWHLFWVWSRGLTTQVGLSPGQMQGEEALAVQTAGATPVHNCCRRGAGGGGLVGCGL